MPTPRVEVLGVHPLEVTDGLVSQSVAMKYPGTDVDAPGYTTAIRHVLSELNSTTLFEVRVSNRNSGFRVDDFGQPESDQAAYCEVFLSADGTAVVSEGFEVPDGDLRIAFYLHLVDASKPLRTSYGDVVLPPLTSMPDRLRKLAPYEPVD